jgi:hypothetical protein
MLSDNMYQFFLFLKTSHTLCFLYLILPTAYRPFTRCNKETLARGGWGWGGLFSEDLFSPDRGGFSMCSWGKRAKANFPGAIPVLVREGNLLEIQFFSQTDL